MRCVRNRSSFDVDIGDPEQVQLNGALYKMLILRILRCFTLVLIICAFNVVGSIMMILDKKKNLKTYLT
jgi:hypothetical protein